MSVDLIKNEDSVFTSLYFSFHFSSNYFPHVLLKYQSMKEEEIKQNGSLSQQLLETLS